MSFSKKLITLAAPFALLALNACATGLPTQVSRFQTLPPPQGQTFVIQPANQADLGGLEFGQYAELVRRHLIAQGFSEASSPQNATLVVSLDYGIDQGQTKVVTRPSLGYGGFGYGGFGYGGFGHGAFGRPFYSRFGHPFYSRFGYFGSGLYPFYYGWHDPFFSPFDYPEVRSYTLYTSYLDMDIKRAADGQSLFEGTAKARSRTDELQKLVPNLVEAMFTGFPGNSGETVRITVPTDPRRR